MDGHPRSIKIAPDERTGWSSDRPRRPGEPERAPRQADIGVRCKVLRPADRIRYSPGSLLVITGVDEELIEGFAARAVEERGALLSVPALRKLIAGKVADDELDAKALALREGLAAKRLAGGDSVVVLLPGLDPDERDAWARRAAAHRRPRHLLLLEGKAADLDDDWRAALNEFRSALDAGQLGAEGFFTAMRLGGQAVTDRRRIVFAPQAPDE